MERGELAWIRLRQAAVVVLTAVMPVLATAGPWSYHTKKDQMTGASVRLARIDSVNSLNLNFPYQGHNPGRITVRDRDGVEVMVQVLKGQIPCHSFMGGCNALVKFDQEPSETYSAVGPSDHSTEVIFLQAAARFVERARSAKKIMVRFEMFQAGNQTLIFSTSKPLVFD